MAVLRLRTSHTHGAGRIFLTFMIRSPAVVPDVLFQSINRGPIRAEEKTLKRADQLHADSTDFVRVHIVILARIRLADVAPCARLPHGKAELFVSGSGFGEIVYGHANMLDAFSMALQEIFINIGWSGWRLGIRQCQAIIVLSQLCGNGGSQASPGHLPPGGASRRFGGA